MSANYPDGSRYHALLLIPLCVLLTKTVSAQVAAPPVDASTLARYDTNKNGRLDPDELAAMRADQAKDVAPAPSAPEKSADIVQLSPFEVHENNTGYYAANTMSGTRLNTKLEDLGAAISVVTKQQMQDFALVDINDVFAYEANTEGTYNFTSFDVDRNGMVTDQIQNNPGGANRIRAIGAANIALDNFATSGRMPVDPSMIDSLEISRGPNSSIFGLGLGSGTVNMVISNAHLDRPISHTDFRVDDLGGWRADFDVSRPLLEHKAAIRVSAVRQHDAFQRKPSGFDQKRFNVFVRVQPFKNTSVKASYLSYRGNGTRQSEVTPRDAISYWKSVGGPTWDPVTSTLTVNGKSAQLTYLANGNFTAGTFNGIAVTGNPAFPAGLGGENFNDPVVYVDGGIKLWEISRMPLNNATGPTTFGPNNVAGTPRLLESVPEPIRTGHPLYSTVPGVSDRSIYDYGRINLAAPNYLQERVEISTVSLEQMIINTRRNQLAVQAAWQREDDDQFNRNIIGQASATGASYYLYIDPNQRLLDGRANPDYLHPYIGAGEPVLDSRPYTRDTYRGQLAYILDVSDSDRWYHWLGRHQFLGYVEQRKTKTFRYRFRDVNVVDNPLYAPAGVPKANQSTTNGFGVAPLATRPYFHFYAGDDSGANVDYAPSGYSLGSYTFNWYNPTSNQWVAEAANLQRAGITEGTAGTNGVLNLLKTRGAMMQNSVLENRVVTTFGWRHDENLNKNQQPPFLQADGWNFDYARMNGWVGDWASGAGDTSQSGVVVKPFRNWGFIDALRNEGGARGFVGQLLNGMTVFYNTSDSFLPEAPAISILQNPLPNPTSKDKEFGLSVNLFDGKFVVRWNRYDTKQVNSRAGQSAIFAQRTLRVDFERFAGNNDAISLQRQARVWLTAQGLAGTALDNQIATVMGLSPTAVSVYNNNVISETSDVIAKGDEIELNYNPGQHWTMRANITRQEAIDANLSPNIPAWIAQRLPVWETIIDPRTGTKWLDTGYNGDNPNPGSGTPRQFLQNNVIAPLGLATALEGKKRAETREWRVNVSTNYYLSGLIDHGWLSRANVGGAIRWESKGAIGYYGIPVNGDYTLATQYDPNRPIWNSAHTYLDAFVGYTTRIYKDKVRAKFQLNVRNLQESHVRLQKIGAFPDGRGHTFRIVDPRTFILTASFDL